ncbi:MAG TPA: hypothetical protein VEI83_09680 [Acidimicrobiales bacterium]|nr:hypothetical protein [Acidimicrobiales bacterium]
MSETPTPPPERDGFVLDVADMTDEEIEALAEALVAMQDRWRSNFEPST